ncbi:MAG: DCC1-like thiol-disulfide oxidoreductase family protein [Bacteroidales bacterium]|nr:DCC1-like thiol-disulfide oxidoreductase family protein [Bacteroidales bacterium]
MMQNKQAVILYDGYCELCSRSLQFVIRRDRENKFTYLSLQSEQGAALISEMAKDKQYADSIVYHEGENFYQRSTAVLKILRRLKRGWQFFYVFMLVPRFLRDLVYDFIAKNRYAWFGRRNECYIPEHHPRHLKKQSSA